MAFAMTTPILPLTDASARETALRCLRDGGLVALPTETVYGLAADATNGAAVARIFEAKGRPSFNPLIAHVADIEMARRIALFGPLAERLAELFWPGPLTLVLPATEDSPVHPLVQAGLPTIAVRMPRGPAQDILRQLDRPLAAPSANPSGRVSSTSADQVLRGLDRRIDLILDGGPSSLGLESTILKPEAGRIMLLRPGALTAEDIIAATGIAMTAPGEAIEAPGQMRSHYAPAGRVRLNAISVEPGEYLIAFGPHPLAGEPKAGDVFNLSAVGDLREAAANLFGALARFDSPRIERVAVARIPMHGLGAAINDRLTRAAAPR